ncbi:MAG: 16S rRNA (cytosine(1402)-N(4))-methyltransferase RsmH [Nannocystaceae bacterium]|nr:16S rRNA (cytosine(1402)-N(4))-methyltransferase RsmH [Nannocystaceae bacterium]
MADLSSAPDAHVSVLAAEVVQALAPPLAATSDSILVDATTGLGGHTLRLLEAATPGLTVLLDRDTDALALAKERLNSAPCPLHFVHAPFSAIASELAAVDIETVTAIVADLGVSSIQLDRVERGFSFRGDAALDMRMDPSRGETAADVLADIQVPELTSILAKYGNEPDARRIAGAIVKMRPTTTAALADIVTNAMTGRQRRKLGLRIHPATRTFQALRIHVNDELGELQRLLADAPSLLAVGGRLGIITFHSLEDRRVKHRFRELSAPPQLPPHLPILESERPRPKFSLPSEFARGVTPSTAELDANPRSRSARLRVLQRDLP